MHSPHKKNGPQAGLYISVCAYRDVSLATDPIIQSYMFKSVALTVIRMDYVYLLSPSRRLNVGF
jgi:hypothetical protein